MSALQIRRFAAQIVDDAWRKFADLGEQNSARQTMSRGKRFGVLRADRVEHQPERRKRRVVAPPIDAMVKLANERLELGIRDPGDFGAQITHSVANGPNDLKLSDCGARRGSCVVRRSEDIRASVKGGSDETLPDKK